VSTFQLFDAEPFDTIQISIPSRGINSEFIITQIEYNWSEDSTTLSIVENRGFDDDLLVRLAEKTERVDLRQTDPQAVEDRIVSSQVSAEIDSTVFTFRSTDITSTVTNDCVDAVVSGWGGDGNINISEMVIGDGESDPSRSDSTLENQIQSASVTETLRNPTSVQYDASFGNTLASEIGLKDAAGNLLVRGTYDPPVQVGGAIIRFDISDATEQNGVVTETGQTAIRDIIADNNPDVPTFYGVGADQTQPAISDTSLTNQIQSDRLNRTLLQRFDTATEFANATQIPDDSPVTIDQQNDAVTMQPVTYVQEAENVSLANPQNADGSVFNSVTTLSNDAGLDISDSFDFIDFNFTLNQDVPAGELFVGVYAELDNWDGKIRFDFDGITYRRTNASGVTTQNAVRGTDPSVNNSRLEAGTQHTLSLVTTRGSPGDYIVDALFAFDNRARFNISNPSSQSFTGSTYEQPELFADDEQVSFPAFDRTRRLITELELFQSWNDTTGNAAVTFNLGGSNVTVNNPTRNSNGNIREVVATNSTVLSPARVGSIDISLSRFNDTTDDSFPLKGDASQEVTFHNLDGNPDAITRSDIGEATVRTVFRSGTLSGNTLRESGQLAGADLLTHSVFADIDPGNDTIIPVERIRFIPE
jgi:hypothetical protein